MLKVLKLKWRERVLLGNLNKTLAFSVKQIQLSLMSGENIHGDSLLSSISNISVKIDHTQIDDPVFFRCAYGKGWQDEGMEYEVPIEMIDDNREIDQGSLMERVYLKCKDQLNANDQVDTWVASKDAHGQSQDESEQQLELCLISSSHHIKKQRKSPQLRKPQHPSAKLRQRNKQQPLTDLQEKRLKNETKNIPKNYGKAIITFIQKYQDKVREIVERQGVEYGEFLLEVREKKKVINTIADLRNMWVENKYANCMRVLSNLFLRKYSLCYIFNSRICNFSSHIKYRHRLAEAIKHPHSFKHIKDY